MGNMGIGGVSGQVTRVQDFSVDESRATQYVSKLMQKTAEGNEVNQDGGGTSKFKEDFGSLLYAKNLTNKTDTQFVEGVPPSIERSQVPVEASAAESRFVGGLKFIGSGIIKGLLFVGSKIISGLSSMVGLAASRDVEAPKDHSSVKIQQTPLSQALDEMENETQLEDEMEALLDKFT